MDLQNRYGPTPLWNAVNVAIGGLGNQPGRRVVLVFTDGDDNPANGRTDNSSLADVMERAQQRERHGVCGGSGEHAAATNR